MQVFVTGGTGFVGQEVIRQLIAAGHRVVALARAGSAGKLPKSPQVRGHVGDVTDPQCLFEGMGGCDALIHLVGIIREAHRKDITFQRLHVDATRYVLEAATARGVRRCLHMSANGVRADSHTAYHRSKWLAEEAVRASQLDWTIFRPSVIFGPGSAFVAMLARMVRSLPVVPVIGNGRYRLQPVAVHQVAETFVKALGMPATVTGLFYLGGSKSYSYDRILDLVGKALGRGKVAKLHHPASLLRPAIALFENFKGFPITLDQLTMLLEGNVCDPRPWAEAFDISPLSFGEGLVDCFRGGP